MTQDDKITVKIDPDLEELIPGFLENRRQDIIKLNQAHDTGDLETLHIIGHNLKGSGGGYGFDEMSRLGAEIENAAKQNDLQSIRGLINALDQYLSRIDTVFE